MRFTIILVLVCLNTPIVEAMEAATSSNSITLKQVVIKVLEKNPQLSIHDHEAKAAAARIRQAKQTTPLELKMEFGNIIGSGDYNGIDQMETTLSLAKLLEPEAKRASRTNLAKQQTQLLFDEQSSTRLDLLALATEQFVHVVIDQHRLKIAKDHLTLIKHTNELVAKRVKIGKSHIAEQHRLTIELARAEVDLEHAEHELSSSRLKLAIYWGESQADFGEAEADLFLLPSIPPFTKLEGLLDNNPDLVLLATEQRIAKTRLRLAQSRRTSDFSVTGGIRYFNNSRDAALMASISMPLGSHSRAQPKIDEMQYLAQRESRRFQLQRLTLYSSLYELYQELLHARTAFEALNQRIIPAAQQAAKDYEQGYQSGRFSLLELNEAQSTLLDARMEVIMTAANYHRLKIEIERLTGVTLYSGEKS